MQRETGGKVMEVKKDSLVDSAGTHKKTIKTKTGTNRRGGVLKAHPPSRKDLSPLNQQRHPLCLTLAKNRSRDSMMIHRYMLIGPAIQCRAVLTEL